MAGDDQWLDAPEVARRLGISEGSVYRLVAGGDLAALRWPLRVSESALQDYSAGSRTTPTS